MISELFWWQGTSEADRRELVCFLGNVPKHFFLPKYASTPWYSCVYTNLLEPKLYLWLQIWAPPFPKCHRETLERLNWIFPPKWEPGPERIISVQNNYCTFYIAQYKANWANWAYINSFGYFCIAVQVCIMCIISEFLLNNERLTLNSVSLKNRNR